MEGEYLCAIINRETARKRIELYQARGQWGARHFDKVIFNLPIPRFDPKNKVHAALSKTAEEAEEIAAAIDLPADVKFQRARGLVRTALTKAGVAKRIDDRFCCGNELQLRDRLGSCAQRSAHPPTRAAISRRIADRNRPEHFIGVSAQPAGVSDVLGIPLELISIDLCARAEHRHTGAALKDVAHLCRTRMPVWFTHALVADPQRKHGNLFNDRPKRFLCTAGSADFRNPSKAWPGRPNVFPSTLLLMHPMAPEIPKSSGISWEKAIMNSASVAPVFSKW
jgi:hypothetical protein